MNPRAYLVYKYYGKKRNKPLCVIIDNSIEEAIRKIGGTLRLSKNNEFRISIPLKNCQRGVGGGFYYINGTIRLKIDSEIFTSGGLALVEVPLFRAAS